MNRPNFNLMIGLLFMALFVMVACSADDDNDEPAPLSDYLTEGFILSGSRGPSNYAGYFSEIPTGMLDLAANATAFENFRIRAMKDGFMYGSDPQGTDPDLVKFAVSREDSTIVELGRLALDGDPSGIVLLDNETGLVSNFTNQRILIFNPSTMLITGEVDMSNAHTNDNDNNYYFSLFHNEMAGKVYAVFFTNILATPNFYDDNKVYVEVIDANTLSWERTIIHQEAQYPAPRGESENKVIDEAGNTYLIAQGSYGLDRNIGPDAPAGSRPRILKINSNSQFDESYAWNPIDALGFPDLNVQLFVTLIYVGNGKAYGVGSGTDDDPNLIILLEKYVDGTITGAEFGQLVGLVTNGGNMVVIAIDLNSRTATRVNGIDLFNGWVQPTMYNYGNSTYVAVSSPSEGETWYEINNTTDTGTKILTLTNAGLAFHLLDLSEEL